MHYTTHYEGSPIVRHNKAIADIKDWLGKERFETITKLMREKETEQPTLEVFTAIVSFAGVQGYPVKAWYNHCFPV